MYREITTRMVDEANKTLGMPITVVNLFSRASFLLVGTGGSGNYMEISTVDKE